MQTVFKLQNLFELKYHMGFEYAASPGPSRLTHTPHSASWGLFIWRVIVKIHCVGNDFVAVHINTICASID